MITLVTADDEELARKSLELMIMTELYDVQLVASAGNGAEFISIVEQYNPDIAIVDITMPVINGIDAIQFLQNRNCRTKFILLTAYNDFSYMQQAIDLKVSAYLLKSDKREKTVDTIRRIIDDIKQLRNEQENLKRLADIDTRMLPIMENEILYSIFLDRPAYSSFQTYYKLRKLTFSGMYMVNMIPSHGTEALYASLVRKNVISKEELSALMGSLCQYMLSLSFMSTNMLVFVPCSLPGTPQDWITDVLTTFRQAAGSVFGVDFLTGVSAVYKDFSDMGRAYKESIEVLQPAAAGGLYLFTHDASVTIRNSREEKTATEVLYRLRRGAVSDLLRFIDELEKQQHIPEPDHFLTVICQTAKDTPDIPSSLCISLFRTRKEYTNITGKKELADALVHAAEIYSGDGSEPQNPYAVKAVAFIKAHASERISLSSVADQIGISPFYLSRLIKTTYNVTFTDFLMNLRMAKALE
ncbi:MAG: response regulator, partial [Treponema sp.]